MEMVWYMPMHDLSSTFPEISNFIGGGVPQGHGDLYIFLKCAFQTPSLHEIEDDVLSHLRLIS
jgi:hypothetical protein